ncbi:MAG: hypothetical protein K2M79_01405 [Muribaculaceae bacterium]|nr:hypothetical protein [Muribaculaceae bacterium]
MNERLEKDPLEILKAEWQRIETTNTTDIQRIAERARHARSAAQKLIHRYTRMEFLGFAFFPMGYLLHRIVPHMSIWIILLYIIFGVSMGIVNGVFASYIKKIASLDTPVVEALHRAIKIQKFQRYTLIVSFIFAACMISLMLYVFYYTSEDVFFGGVLGVVIGLPIGIYKAIDEDRQIRRMINAYREVAFSEGII